MMIGFDRRKFIDFFPFIKQKVKNIKATWEALSVYEEERENLGREKKKEGFRQILLCSVFQFADSFSSVFFLWLLGTGVWGGKVGFLSFFYLFDYFFIFLGKSFQFFWWGLRDQVLGCWVVSGISNHEYNATAEEHCFWEDFYFFRSCKIYLFFYYCCWRNVFVWLLRKWKKPGRGRNDQVHCLRFLGFVWILELFSR